MARDLFEAENVQPRDLFQEESVGEEEPSETKGRRSGGLISDTMKLFNHALQQGTKFLTAIPGQLKGIGEEFKKDPLGETGHALGQLGVGLGNSAKSLANLGLSALTPLSELGGIPEGGHPFEYQIPETTGLQQALGLESNKKGDELIEEIPDIAALTTGLYGVAKSGGKFLSKTLPKGEEKVRRNAMTEDIIKAAKDHGASKEELKALKDSLAEAFTKTHRSEPGSMTPSKQRQKADIKEGEIERLQAAANIPEKHVGEIPQPPDTQTMISQKKSALEDAQKEAEKVVGIKDNPRLSGGAKVKKAIEDVKTKASDLYNAARRHYVDKKVKVDNSKEIKAIGKDINELSANEGVFEGTESERETLQAKINLLEGQTVDASNLFDLQRTLEKMAENTRDKQYASGNGTTDLQRKRYGQVADKLESHAKFLEKKLESVGGKEVQSMIKDANKGWRTFKSLEKQNPVGKGALKGELPIRSMVEITKAHPGNDFLSALVESDPELKKQILAAFTGDKNVSKLLNPDTLTKKYIQSLPEVDEHVNALKQALTGVKEGEVQASKVKKEYDSLVKSMKDAANEQKVRLDAVNQIEKLAGEIKSHKESATALKKKIAEANAKGQNTAELEEDFARHKREYNDKGNRMDKLKKIALKYAGAKIGYESIVHKDSH